MVPEAFFDSLHIAAELGQPLDGVSRMGFQRIAFLSCLLSIYAAKPVAEWGYRFANTGAGTPFSDELNDALVNHLANGRLLEHHGRLTISETGRVMLATMCSFESLATRAPCLDAACASVLTVSRSTLINGLDHEPSVAASHLRSGATMLLDGPHERVLHEHFATLAQVIPPSMGDLFTPSVLWLSYLSETRISQRDTGTPGEALL